MLEVISNRWMVNSTRLEWKKVTTKKVLTISLPAQFLSWSKYFVDKFFQHRGGFDQPADPQYLGDGDRCEEKTREDVNCCHQTEQELELVDSSTDVASETETEYFEESLNIVEYNEADL